MPSNIRKILRTLRTLGKLVPRDIAIEDEKEIRFLNEEILNLIIESEEPINDTHVYIMRANNKLKKLEQYINNRTIENWGIQLKMNLD